MNKDVTEHSIERSILSYLNGLDGVKAVKWSQDGRQRGNPDIIACVHGRLLLIEVKRPGERPDKLQTATMVDWWSAGAVVMWASNLEDVKRYIASTFNV